MDTELGLQMNNFEDEISVTAWRPTLQIQVRNGSSAFCIKANKISEKSYHHRLYHGKSIESDLREGLLLKDGMTVEQRRLAIEQNTKRMQVEKFAAKPNKNCCRFSYEKVKKQ